MSRNAQTAIVALSGTALSTPFNLAAARDRAALHIPTITSCQLSFKAATDKGAAAADFLPLHNNLGSLYTINAGAGSLSIALDNDVVGGVSNLQVEFSVAQAAIRSLSLLYKL